VTICHAPPFSSFFVAREVRSPQPRLLLEFAGCGSTMPRFQLKTIQSWREGGSMIRTQERVQRKWQQKFWLAAGLAVLVLPLLVHAAQPAGANSYRNPILFADYSDPDVIRDGGNYYLVASTFHFVPGIPILQSTDLVHWTIAGHAVSRLDMDPRYNLVGGNRYGKGIWAPSVRQHNGLFYIYFPTPTEGIFVTTAPKMTGPWSAPVAVIVQPGLEDPCPFWDDDGNAYLVHSRTGAGPLILHRMSADGMHVLDEGKVIVEDAQHLPVLEGPKFYKRDGYYYIFAPFGGVSTGSQVVLRSRQIYGPFEHRVVLAQGATQINGPHQGAYVETPTGEGWFVHFQYDGAHGRIVHLEPVHWQDGWPVIGVDPDGASPGQPTPTGPMPAGVRTSLPQRPQTSDEFDGPGLGPQWEWNHNPDDAHWSLAARPGFLRLIPQPADGLLAARNTLTQCMQDNAFEFTARLDVAGMKTGGHAGLSMFEKSAGGIEIVQSATGRRLDYFHLPDRVAGPAVTTSIVQLRVRVEGEQARFSYSLDDGKSFRSLGPAARIHFSWWKGSRPALFAYTSPAADPGFVDFDWVHDQPLGENPW
jgi:beta-xylosidase